MSDKPDSKNNFAVAFPELLGEWYQEKNRDLSPYDLSPYSGKKVWWKCQQGHEWESTISNRTGQNRNGCPVCSGRRASDLHNLARLFPDLLNEWCYEKNTSLDPEKVTPYSHQKVWWKCKEGHEWQTGIVYRTRQKSGCPYCSGRLAGLDNSLAVLHPALAKEWYQEKNGNLTPNDVRPGTDRNVWWLCEKGHSWEAAVCHRTHKTKATGCPYCSGRNATVENNLKVLFPELAAEWDFTKNDPLRPEMVKPGSNKKVWWRCVHGHEWLATPSKRTGEGTNCPNCAPQTSRLEIRLFCELKYIFGNSVEWRYKIDGIEVDLFLPKYSVGLEIDGFPWHENKEDKDIAKTAKLLKREIKLFRLRDSKLPIIEESDIFYGSIEDELLSVST
jgi:very-short-patch-repair endonuclease